MSGPSETAPRGRGAQTARNLVTNVGMFATQTVVALWFTPFLITALGVAVFGLIPLANTLATYIGVITISIQGAVARFLTISTRRGETEDANELFNTALWATLGLSALLVPPLGAVAWFAPTLFSVPDAAASSVRLFFALTLLAYLVSVARSVFMTAGVSSNRLDVQNLAPLTEVGLRPALTLAAFAGGAVTLSVVGWASLAAVLASFMVSVVIWRRLAPEITISPRRFSLSWLRRMWATSGWMMVSQLGTLLFLGIDIVIANVVLGAETAGRYGAVLIWSTFLRGAASAASGVVTPVALSAFAAGDEVELTALMRSAVRLMGLAVGLPVFIVAGMSSPLLEAWLGPEFTSVSPLLAVLVGHLVVNLAVLPLFALSLAKDRVRVPGLVTLAMGVLNVALAWVLAGANPTGLGIALAGAVVLTAKNAVFTPLYASHIQGIAAWTYFADLVPGLALSASFGMVAWLLSRAGVVAPTLLGVAAVAMALAAVYCGASWLLLRDRERQFVRRIAFAAGGVG